MLYSRDRPPLCRYHIAGDWIQPPGNGGCRAFCNVIIVNYRKTCKFADVTVLNLDLASFKKINPIKLIKRLQLQHVKITTSRLENTNLFIHPLCGPPHITYLRLFHPIDREKLFRW